MLCMCELIYTVRSFGADFCHSVTCKPDSTPSTPKKKQRSLLEVQYRFSVEKRFNANVSFVSSDFVINAKDYF